LEILRGDAIATAKLLERIASKLRYNAVLEPNPDDITPESDVNNRLTPDEVAGFATISSISKLIKEMKKARQDVFNLRKLRRV
jgi:hypothetical protein